MTAAIFFLLTIGACILIAGAAAFKAGKNVQPKSGDSLLSFYLRKQELVESGFAAMFWGGLTLLAGIALLAYNLL